MAARNPKVDSSQDEGGEMPMQATAIRTDTTCLKWTRSGELTDVDLLNVLERLAAVGSVHQQRKQRERRCKQGEENKAPNQEIADRLLIDLVQGFSGHQTGVQDAPGLAKPGHHEMRTNA